jgi:uncharacterized protein DUF4062
VFSLKVFISGRESEMRNERLIIARLIESHGFRAVASETRPASDKSVRDEYLREVASSNIYIGLFSLLDSEASRAEYAVAPPSISI